MPTSVTISIPETDLLDGPAVMLPQEQGEGSIRTRWCCETFGMGEQVEVVKPHSIGIIEAAENLAKYSDSSTTDANDNETLRRWMSE